jgi:hypothetical protein
MTPILCDRCADAVVNVKVNTSAEEETLIVPDGCDPLDELAQLDAILARLAVKRHDLKEKVDRLHRNMEQWDWDALDLSLMQDSS